MTAKRRKRVVLTERDHRSVKATRISPLTTMQGAELEFNGNRKKAAERFKKLADAGYIQRTCMPIQTGGRPEYLYYPNNKRLPRGYDWLPHALTISSYHVAFQHWLRQQDDLRGEFQPSQHLANGTLRPDASYTISRGTKTLLYFLEIDRATTALSSRDNYSLEGKLQKYAAYFDDDGYQELGPYKGFRVTLLLPTQARFESLCQHLREARHDFILVAKNDQVGEQLFTTPEWTTSQGMKVCLTGEKAGEQPGEKARPQTPTRETTNGVSSTSSGDQD